MLSKLHAVKIRTPLFFTILVLGCFAFLSNMHAVSPPPDGGYPGGNTAERQSALFSLTSGGYNPAVGYYSLRSNTSGIFNTAIGAGTLFAATGGQNTATGAGALLSNSTGGDNTANGVFALVSNTGGGSNNAFGVEALRNHITGDFNNAVGVQALFHDQGGAFNDAFGDSALLSNINGVDNAAVGDSALEFSTGNDNTALGGSAGLNATTGSGNVYIGAFVEGASGEDNHTYIRNINTTTVSGGGTDFVTVNLTTGLLGHNSSSRRYKEDIKPMDKASEALYRLRPVTYRFKKDIDASQSLEYGLVAEDVAAVDPNLAIRGGGGQTESVRYTAINAMLLNEFLKEHRKVERQDHKIQEQESTIAELKCGMKALVATVNEQALQLQKVSTQLELTKPEMKVAAEKP
jgi:hypothetical protein